ncbi:MAG: hypothetical protein WCR54_08235 [Clostridia bacterium]
MSKYIKNIITNDTPESIKALNENFDFLYLQQNKPVTNIATIQMVSDDNFVVSYTNQPYEKYTAVRGPDTSYISKLSTFKRDIKIYHSVLGEDTSSK